MRLTRLFGSEHRLVAPAGSAAPEPGLQKALAAYREALEVSSAIRAGLDLPARTSNRRRVLPLALVDAISRDRAGLEFIEAISLSIAVSNLVRVENSRNAIAHAAATLSNLARKKSGDPRADLAIRRRIANLHRVLLRLLERGIRRRQYQGAAATYLLAIPSWTTVSDLSIRVSSIPRGPSVLPPCPARSAMVA